MDKRSGAEGYYEPRFHPKHAKQLKMLGLSDKQIAEKFEISETTISRWKTKYPKFKEALKRGAILADGAVANALFERATGYVHPEVKVFNDKGTPLQVEVERHHPPDSQAAIFWLKNRAKDAWRDRQEIDQTSLNLDRIEDYHALKSEVNDLLEELKLGADEEAPDFDDSGT